MNAASLRFCALNALLGLGGCVNFSGDAGLGPAIDVAATTLNKDVLKVTSDVEAASAAEHVDRLLKQPLTVDAAVQIALLRNKDLQAAFNDLGVSEAQYVQASLPPSPQFSISRLAGQGDIEVTRQIAASLFALATLPSRTAIATKRFDAARWRTAEKVLALAADVGRQYYTTVALQEQEGFLRQAQASAQVSTDLARQLGEAGNLNKLEQAREGAFSVELGAQLANARLQGRAERERLTRLLGLWGKEITFRLPKGLPPLPRKITTELDVEARALRERVDLKAGREDLAATAADLGLTNATRFVTDVTLALQDDREWNNGGGGSNLGSDTNTRLVRRGFSLDFEIPIYDFGESKIRDARETYMAAANRLAQRAIDARSQARETYTRYRGKYDLARYYADRVLPLRKTILDQSTLQTNGMLVDVTQLIIDGRARITSNVAAIAARRDFFLASVDLKAALVGGGGLGAKASSPAPGSASEAAN